MPSDFTLRTVTEYLQLPELEISVVSDGGMPGRICLVLSVDFYLAAKSDCDERGLEAMDVPNLYRCALPTAVIEINDEPVFFRLPHSLSPWAFELVMSQGGSGSSFPAFVDFGIQRDQHYARFL